MIETLVALLLVTCLIWGTLPQFLRHQKERELKLACLTLQQTFVSVRFQAIKNRNNFEVMIGSEGNTLRVRNVGTGQTVGREERLPDGIRIVSISKNLPPIIFRPDGGLAGISGSMIIRDERTGREKKIILYNLTGKSKVEGL